MAQKPSIPKGTRDFGPMEMAKRNYIFNTIKDVYALYGFQQIETPAMETLQTLMGKYGEEGDKLLFKVLNSGDFMNKVSDDELRESNSLHLAAKLSQVNNMLKCAKVGCESFFLVYFTSIHKLIRFDAISVQAKLGQRGSMSPEEGVEFDWEVFLK